MSVEEYSFDNDLRQLMMDYDLGAYAHNFQRCGIRSMEQIQMLWRADECFFGDAGYNKGSLLIVRAVLDRFRDGRDKTLDMEEELYAVLKAQKLLQYAFLLEAAGIRRVADIGQIWDAKRNFGLHVGSAHYGFWDLRCALAEAYGFKTRNNTYLRIGAHSFEYSE